MPLISSTLKIGNNSSTGHDHITVEGEFVSNLIPNAHGSYNLGEATKMWDSLYVVNIQTSITDKQMVFSDGGVLSGSSMTHDNGKVSLGSSAYSGGVLINNASVWPRNGLGSIANYQLMLTGSTNTNRGVGIGFGTSTNVGASISFEDKGTNSIGDLLFYTKEDTVVGNDPTLRMVMRYDGKIGIGNIYVPYGKLSVYDQNLNPLSSLTTTTNYHLGLYGTASVGTGIGMSFGTTTLVGSAIVHKNTGVNNEGELQFYTNNAGSVTEKMVVKSDGKVGIGVNDPYADLEVKGTVGLSGTVDGGELEFRLQGTTATNTQELGRIRFGNDFITQASVYGVASQNWIGGSAHGTSVVISATATNSTTETPIVIFDPTQTYFNYAVYVNNSVTALQFIGNGAQLTGIAKGQPTQMQYNDNGVLNGGVVYYENTTGKVIMGASSAGFSSKLLIHDISLNAYTNLASVSSYHLHISGSSSTGQAMGIGFGRDSSGVGGAVLFEDTGSYNKGDLVFLTKSSISNGVAPVERVRIHGSGIDVKGSSTTFGGKVAFKNGTNYPQTNGTIGLVTFGSILSDNAMIRGGVPSNWNVANRETDISFWITKSGQTTWSEVAVFNGDGLTVNGTVDADYFVGDGSQLTNLPIPSAQGNTYNVQFNNNGSFAGAGYVNYYPSTRGLTVGLANNVQTSGIMVNETAKAPMNAATDVTEYAYVSRYGNTTGASTGFAFYDTTKVTGNFLHVNYGNGSGATAFYVIEANSLTNYLTLGLGKVINYRPIEINTTAFNGQTAPLLNIKGSSLVNYGASIHLSANAYPTAIIRSQNLGSYGYGILEFLLEEDQSAGTTPQMYLQMGVGKADFYRQVGITTDNEPNENPQTLTAHQLYLKGNNYSSVGLSMGSPNGVAWSIHTNIESVTNSKQGDLLFKKPSSGTSNTYIDILTLTKDGNVKVSNSIFSQTATIGTGYPNTAHGEYLQVQNEASVAGGNGGFLRLRKNANSYSYINTGDTLGEVSFGSGTFSPLSTAKIIGKAKSNWALNSYPSEVEFWTTDTDGFVKRMTVSDKIEAHKQIVATNGLYSQYSTVEAKYTKGQYARHQYYQNLSGTHMFAYVTGSGSTGNATWMNWGSADIDFRVQANNGDSVLMVDAGDTSVILGTPHGEATVEAEYDLLNNSRGSVFVQGMTDENTDDGNGCVMAISNLSAGTKADGLGIVLGRDVQASFGFTSGLFGYQQVNNTTYVGYPETSNGYINFYFRNYIGSTNSWTVTYAGGCRGDGSGGVSFFSSFTGQHATVTELEDSHKVGMIMISTGEIWHGDTLSTALPRTKPTDVPKDKRVYGVLATKEGGMDGYTAISPPKENETQVEVNSLGEGRVLVTNIGGNIENGDYICSSEILGYGMLQDDDLLHNYTVAKCTESINWDDPNLETIEHNGQTYKVYLSACTYHCG